MTFLKYNRFLIKGVPMKKSVLAFSLIAIGFASNSFAGSFDGLSITGAVDNSKNTITGGPVMVIATNTQLNQAGLVGVTDGSASKTGLKLGAQYGMDLGEMQLTFGLDYSTAKAEGYSTLTSNNVASTDPTNRFYRNIKNRTDVFVAPGINLDNISVAYIKLGYSTFSYDNVPTPPSTTSNNSGSPGKSGMHYGFGYKRKLDDKSPYFIIAEYISGKTSSGQINNVPATIYVDTKNKFTSFNIGIGYNFK